MVNKTSKIMEHIYWIGNQVLKSDAIGYHLVQKFGYYN